MGSFETQRPQLVHLAPSMVDLCVCYVFVQLLLTAQQAGDVTALYTLY